MTVKDVKQHNFHVCQVRYYIKALMNGLATSAKNVELNSLPMPQFSKRRFTKQMAYALSRIPPIYNAPITHQVWEGFELLLTPNKRVHHDSKTTCTIQKPL